MFARIGYTWQIMGASWQILKRDKELLLFTLLSGICCLVVMATFAMPMVGAESLAPPEEGAPLSEQVAYYGVLFLFYFCMYFIITFFNAAVVSSAVVRMGGGDPTFGDGLRAAFERLPYILGWSLLAATVGLVLRIIEDRSEKVGRIVAGLLGMAWTVVTFLAVPVLVVEKKGPGAALKKSTALLRKTWGEQLVSGFSFGIIFFLLALLGVPLLLIGFFLWGAMGGWVALALGVIYFVILGLVQSTLETIFRAALYVYAEVGQVPAGFDGALLHGAMAHR